MNSCQNEINIEMRYYPIVEIKMVLRQPDNHFCKRSSKGPCKQQAKDQDICSNEIDKDNSHKDPQ